MTDTPELRTNRLLMRRWRTEDRARFDALKGDPALLEHGLALWTVEVPGTVAFVGFVGLAPVGDEFAFGPAVEVSWRLERRYFGMGYATEGARAALRCGAETFGIGEFVAFAPKTDLLSQRVMRRLGMSHAWRDDFDHPHVAVGDPLRPSVLYRTAATLPRVDTQRAMVTTTGTDPVVVTAVGEFDFESSDRLRSALMVVAQEFEGDVVVDLSRTEFLDSIAIGVLLQTWQRLRAVDRELVIRSPHERIRRVLQIAAIDEVVRIDHDDAL